MTYYATLENYLSVLKSSQMEQITGQVGKLCQFRALCLSPQTEYVATSVTSNLLDNPTNDTINFSWVLLEYIPIGEMRVYCLYQHQKSRVFDHPGRLMCVQTLLPQP